jgi:hypothetical protein
MKLRFITFSLRNHNENNNEIYVYQRTSPWEVQIIFPCTPIPYQQIFPPLREMLYAGSVELLC